MKLNINELKFHKKHQHRLKFRQKIQQRSKPCWKTVTGGWISPPNGKRLVGSCLKTQRRSDLAVNTKAPVGKQKSQSDRARKHKGRSDLATKHQEAGRILSQNTKATGSSLKHKGASRSSLENKRAGQIVLENTRASWISTINNNGQNSNYQFHQQPTSSTNS